MAILQINGSTLKYSAVELVEAYCPVLKEQYMKPVYSLHGQVVWDAPRHLDIMFYADFMNRIRLAFVKQDANGVDMKHLRKYHVKLQPNESADSYINKVDVKMYQRYLHYHAGLISLDVARLTGQPQSKVKSYFSRRINILVSEYRTAVRKKPKTLDIKMEEYYTP